MNRRPTIRSIFADAIVATFPSLTAADLQGIATRHTDRQVRGAAKRELKARGVTVPR